MPHYAVTGTPFYRGAGEDSYPEQVYAGVLGKLIGVYLGRPVENWSYERIAEEIGDVAYYIHEQRGRRLIITDDDISGTFTFLRALQDYGYRKDLSPAQIGQTWLNYLIEKTTILWWGGMGNSTEHTAYLRLKQGICAPESGSSALNGKILSEQIGAQIFIDGWGLVCPGDPELAAQFAATASRVSHDGEAVYGAQVIAAMVAHAFVEQDLDNLLDRALQQIPLDSVVSRLIADVRSWHLKEPDWRENRLRLQSEYGYDKYAGQCHLIPNHGLIHLSLLHGAGDFDKSMLIINTAGWDTDCNSGNVGTILGVRNGLAAFQRQDWRGPVADRLFLPSADGGRSITDAVRETYFVANCGRALAELPPLEPKEGARFHFSLPGSVQSWRPNPGHVGSVKNIGEALSLSGEAYFGTDTFVPPETKDLKSGYVLVASPTLYSGQRLTADIRGSGKGRLFVGHYNEEDLTSFVFGPEFEAGAQSLEWTIPDTSGYPIHQVGIQVFDGEVVLDRMDWSGIPTTSFPILPGTMAARAWAKSLDRFEHERDRYDYLCHNEGIGLLTQGTSEWQDYRVECRVTPKMAVSGGVAVRVQGTRRFYAVLFAEPGQIRIEKSLDGRRTLAQTSFPWEAFQDYEVEVEVKGNTIRVWIDGKLTLSAVDPSQPLEGGAFGFVVESGCIGAGTPKVMPA